MSDLSSPPPEAPRTSYDLSPAEIEMIRQINLNAITAKAKIYDLQVALEGARKELSAANDAMNGAISMLAHANGLKHAVLTEDGSRLNGVPQ